MNKRAIWIIVGLALAATLGGGGWLAFSMFSSGSGKAGEPTMTRGPAPSFVVAHEPIAAKEAQYDPVGGLRVLLFDQQYDATAAKPAMYTRSVRLVANAAGASEAAKMTAQLDPTYQNLVLNHAKVVRGGSEEDRSTRVKVDFIRQEPGIDYGIITGAVTAVLQLEDVRADDIVDIALTVYGANPTLKGNDSNVFLLSGPIAIERMTLRSIWPEKSVWRVEDGEAEIKEIREKGRLILELGPKPVPAIEFNFNASELPDFPVLWVSGFADWKEVTAWGTPLFRTPAGAEVKEVAEKIKAERADKGAQAIAALRFVQKDIRYLAIVLGEGGYKPQTPTETLRLRYGDCKAKTALLIAILGELGIDAVPALVNPLAGWEVPDMIATPMAFNHVITKVTFDGKTLWLDPTIAQGGDIEHVTQADYGYALPLDGASGALEKIETPVLDGFHIETTETFDLRAGGDRPARMSLSIIARGVAADSLRMGIEAAGGVNEMVKGAYANVYREVEIDGSVDLDDDLEANVLKTAATLKVKSPFMAMGPRRMAMFSANSVTPVLFATESDARKDREVAVRRVDTKHTIRLQIPEDPSWQLPEETQIIENDAFRFHRLTARTEDAYIIDFEMKALASQLSPDKIRSAINDQERLQQLTRISLMLVEPRLKKDLPRLSFAGVPAEN